MTATATRQPYQFVQGVPELRIYHAGRQHFFGTVLPPSGSPPWVRVPHLTLDRLDLTSGWSEPASARLLMARRPTDARVSIPNVVQTCQDLGTRGYSITNTEDTIRPFGLNRWDAFKVSFCANPGSDEEDEVCRFVGFLTDFTLDLETGAMVLELQDFRVLLEGIKVWGARWYDCVGSTVGWLAGGFPIFNPKGLGNMDAYERLAFVDEFYGASGGSGFGTAWKRGDIWNYFRKVHGVAPPADEDVIQTVHYLDWPEATAGGFAKELFTRGTNADANIFPDFHPAGMPLGKVMDLIVRKRADLDTAFEYDGSTGKARPVLYGTGAASLVSGQAQVSLRWGDVAQKVSEARPDVAGGRLTSTVRRTRTRVRAYGAPKKFDLSFQTPVSVAEAATLSLKEDWTSTDQTSWVTLYDAGDEDAGKLYPRVFRRWVVEPGARFATLFGWALNITRKRTGEGFLASYDAADPALRVKILVWRKSGGTWNAGHTIYTGGAWELCPPEYHVALADGALGIEFPAGAREYRAANPDADEETWTWPDDPAANRFGYPMRVTVCVESDERLKCKEGYNPADWPPFEELLQDENYKYAARREAYVPVAATETWPTLQVISRDAQYWSLRGTYHAGPPIVAAADETIQDDTAKLRAAATGLASQFGKINWEGSMPLKNWRLDLQVGGFVTALLAGGSTGTCPDVPLNVPIRALAYLAGDRALTELTLDSG